MSSAGRAYREVIKTVAYEVGKEVGELVFSVENSGIIVSIQDTGIGFVTGLIQALLPGDMDPLTLDAFQADGDPYTKAFICSSRVGVAYTLQPGSILAVSVKYVDSQAVDIWNKQLPVGTVDTRIYLQDIQQELAALREVNDKMLNNIRYITNLSEEGDSF